MEDFRDFARTSMPSLFSALVSGLTSAGQAFKAGKISGKEYREELKKTGKAISETTQKLSSDKTSAGFKKTGKIIQQADELENAMKLLDAFEEVA
jgi:hypothetical protein